MEMQAKLEKLGLTHWIKGEYDRTKHDRDLNASVNILNKGLSLA